MPRKLKTIMFFHRVAVQFHNSRNRARHRHRKRGEGVDISQMRMMLVLADSKSITTTAKKLHVTQPALTYQLKVIENELGFKVFNRTRTGTSYTAEGAFLHETIRQIVDEYDEAVRLARAMAKGSEAGTVRVGINDYSRDTISFFLNVAQSSIAFTLIPCGSSDPVRLLRERVIDLWSTSSASMENAPANLRFAELTEAGQSVFVPFDHKLASRSSVTVNDLQGEIVWLWPRGEASAASNLIRDRLEQSNTVVEDFIPGIPAIVTAFAADGIVVYDDGYLPPPANAAKQLTLLDGTNDILGLAYLSSQEKRLKPIIANLAERVAYSESRPSSPSERAAKRIVALLDDISSTVRRGGMKDIVPLVEYGLDLGISAHHLLNRGLLAGMNAIGEAYRNSEVYMTEMMAAVSTTNLAMEVLQPHFAIEDEKPPSGAAVIGTAAGDKHDIGKNLVRIMMESRDIEVTDLGSQVQPEAFVEHVKNNPRCNLVLISVSRTDLLDRVRETVDALAKAKLRDRVFIMVGGAAASQEFADEIGADAFTSNAEDAADKARELMSL